MPPYAPLVRLQMAQTGRTRAGWSWPHNALLEFATKPTATRSPPRLLRYRDGRGDDWADIIDVLTMDPRTLGGRSCGCSRRLMRATVTQRNCDRRTKAGTCVALRRGRSDTDKES